MLGLLEIDKSLRRVHKADIKLSGYNMLWIKIPNEKKRHLKKAGKLLAGRRVIISESCAEEELSAYGITAISPSKVYRYLAAEIYRKTLEYFKTTPDKAHIYIRAGRIGNTWLHSIEEIIKNARHIAIESNDSDLISEYIMENYGISLSCAKNANIVIDMYEKDFSIHFIKDDLIYRLNGTTVAKDEKTSHIPSTHLKSAYVALIEAGALATKELRVGQITFECEKLT